ncbi:MAG: hypothetical protein AAF922_00505 [Pseudomonadota bacterium]
MNSGAGALAGDPTGLRAKPGLAAVEHLARRAAFCGFVRPAGVHIDDDAVIRVDQVRVDQVRVDQGRVRPAKNALAMSLVMSFGPLARDNDVPVAQRYAPPSIGGQGRHAQ